MEDPLFPFFPCAGSAPSPTGRVLPHRAGAPHSSQVTQQLFCVKGLREKIGKKFCPLKNSYENNIFGCPYMRTKEQLKLEGVVIKGTVPLEKERGKDGGESAAGRAGKGIAAKSCIWQLEAPAKVSDGGFLQERGVRKSRPWSNKLYQALLV